MQYRVISRLEHNGVIHEPGDVIEAHPSEVQQAAAAGAIVPNHEPYSEGSPS